MIKRRKTATYLYVLADYLVAMLAWFLFFTYRKSLEAWPFTMDDVFSDEKLYHGLFFVPIIWLLIYLVFDRYDDIYRFSRLTTLTRTIGLSDSDRQDDITYSSKSKTRKRLSQVQYADHRWRSKCRRTVQRDHQ